MRFLNKVVIVTGAANGIGLGVATAFAKEGAKVVLADVDQQKGEVAVKQLKEQGNDVVFVRADVRSEVEIKTVIETTVRTYGTIDILINNAGKGLFKPLDELSVDEWDDVINTNLRSAFIFSKEAAKVMRKNQGGAMINIASTRALMSEPNSEAYAASKGGIVALTHALAASLGKDRITVNCISPGWIETGDYAALREVDHQQHISQRVGKVDDIARACFYLAAKENDFVTGTNVVVDGGMTRKMIYEE